jgi:acetylornithine/succinyldiaminopimelate/putrescine aminotransferase
VPYNDAAALDKAVTDQTAAVILEVVQGESGVNIGTPDFLKTAQRVCKERGAMLIVDEIQTGFGRTGKMFAVEHSGLEPDMLVHGQGPRRRLPDGRRLRTRKQFAKSLTPGAHGSTFGGIAARLRGGPGRDQHVSRRGAE